MIMFVVFALTAYFLQLTNGKPLLRWHIYTERIVSASWVLCLILVSKRTLEGLDEHVLRVSRAIDIDSMIKLD